VALAGLASEWEAPLPVLVGAALALALFAQGFLRLRRRRPGHAGADRALLYVGAVAIATLALVSPLDAIGEEYLLSGHMLQHVLIGDLAPALAMLALRGPLVFFILPAAVLGPLARLAPLRSLARLLLRPAVTFALWAVAILAWHVPRFYDSTLSHRLVHDLEHASFVFVGTLAWAQLVDPARRGALRRGGRIGFAVALFAVGQLLTDALVFSGRPHYAPYAAQPDRLFGLSPLADQRLAGLVMMLEQLATLGTCIAVLLWPYLVGRERPAGVSQRA
jgi:putative membrane protein